MGLIASLKARAKELKRHTLTVYYVARDRRTPVYIRLLALLVAAYALSPIDLIPDFIPVLGYLDDLLLVPLGLELVVKLTPAAVLEAARMEALQTSGKPVSYPAAALIIMLWLFLLWLAAHWLNNLVQPL